MTVLLMIHVPPRHRPWLAALFTLLLTGGALVALLA